MKTCPHCAEPVQDEAQICNHCNRRIGRAPGARLGLALATGVLFLWIYGPQLQSLVAEEWLFAGGAIAVISVMVFAIYFMIVGPAPARLAGLAGLLLVVGFVAWAIIAAPAVDAEAPRAVAEIEDRGNGTFRDHTFSYGEVVGGDRQGSIVATFTPFLPRDDEAVLAAIVHMVEHHYGDDVGGDDTPMLVGGEIMLSSAAANYYAMLVKESTGEVHSLRITRDRR